MSTKCRQCSGSGMVQTTFGPKPCPSCGGRGYVDGSSASNEDNTGTSGWSFGDWVAAVFIVIAILYGLSKL